MSNQTPDDEILLLTKLVDTGLDIPDIPESSEVENPQKQEAQVWAYLGAVGGVGVSSLAVQTAYELSEHHTEKKICLIDLDFERGSCASYLDVTPSMNLADLNETSGRMDADLAANYIGTYKQKFSVISTPGEMGGNDNVDPQALLGLLDQICGMYDYVILDIPPMWRSWTQAVIGAADKFALVTEMRVPALHRTKKMSNFINMSLSLSTPPDIIINKFERRETSHSISLKNAHDVLGRKDTVQICNDEDAVKAAVNYGKPAGRVAPDTRYVKSVRTHTQHWLGNKEYGEKEKHSLFKRRQKRERRSVAKRA